MFEDSLFESQHHVATPRARWTAAASVSLQAAIASLLVLLPLLHTEVLPARRNAPKISIPLATPPPPPKTLVQRASTALVSAMPAISRVFTAPRILPTRIDSTPEPNIAAVSFAAMTNAAAPAGIFGAGTTGTGVTIHVAPKLKQALVKVSSGVSNGMLLTPIRPVYPPIARAAHVEGPVVVEAVISKAGTIERLHVVSGSEMLQSAAMDAIRVARYRPFLLNGEPTEVQTTITVNFRFGG